MVHIQLQGTRLRLCEHWLFLPNFIRKGTWLETRPRLEYCPVPNVLRGLPARAEDGVTCGQGHPPLSSSVQANVSEWRASRAHLSVSFLIQRNSCFTDSPWAGRRDAVRAINSGCPGLLANGLDPGTGVLARRASIWLSMLNCHPGVWESRLGW